MPKNYPPFRDVSFFLRVFRDILLGRKHDRNHRYSFTIATRSPDPPQLPPGPHSKLSANYYCTRDGRHELKPPLVIVEPKTAGQIESGEKKALPVASLGGVTPGKIFAWDAPEKDAYTSSS